MRNRSQIARAMAVLLWVAVFMVAISCAGTQKQQIISGSYKALSLGGNSYDAAMKGVADLYKQKLVDDTVKMAALELGQKYHDAYHSAVEALKIYAETDTETPETLQEKIYNVGEALGKLLAYINPFLQKYGMEEVTR